MKMMVIVIFAMQLKSPANTELREYQNFLGSYETMYMISKHMQRLQVAQVELTSSWAIWFII